MLTLISGRQIDIAGLHLDRSSYRVYYGGEDITNDMRQADKVRIFPGFDRSKDNERAYSDRYAQEHGGNRPAPTGSTSVLVNFARQIVTDPLAAPLDYADEKVTGRLLGSSTVRIAVTLALIGAVVYFWPAIRPVVKRFFK